MKRPRRQMLECLRERRGPPSLTLRCFRCGLIRQLDDDGRRVTHAWAHVSACPKAPDGASEPQLQLRSSDSLEMTTVDQEIWFKIQRE